MPRIKTILFFAILLFSFNQSVAQDLLIQDYSNLIDIPGTKAIQASETHLYALSEQEGMAVFRNYSDSLQWLYTSSGMQKRGDVISADVRFAYLYGDSRRLTVLEPTSVLGVYSSTLLPQKPLGVARLNNQLYVALGSSGLGTVSLQTPETVDSEIEFLGERLFNEVDVIDLEASQLSKQLFVLTSDSRLVLFRYTDNALEFNSALSLSAPLKKLFIDGDRIWGSTDKGEIYTITGNGMGRKIGAIGEQAHTIVNWRGYTFIRSVSGNVWVAHNQDDLMLWKSDKQAGNFITKSTDRIWVSENGKLTRILISEEAEPVSAEASGPLTLKPIPDRILTYPNSLILALELENNYPAQEVEFSYRGNVRNAKNQKQGLVWSPTPNQLGMNWFTIVATSSTGEVDSTRFTVDLRSFNTPPRFSPVRGSTIAIEEEYQLQFKAIDPENPSSNLIRYLGVDLPQGAQIDETTGLFKWTPNVRQVGETTFKVIASDQLGAASSIEVTLNVLDIRRGDGE